MSIRALSILSTTFLLTAGVLLGACGGDDPAPAGSSNAGGSAGSTGGGGQSAAGTTKVTAASGGTVTDPAGKASLAIPAGALASDTDITLVVGPSEAGTAGEVLTFGPDGTTFAQPATLTIKAIATGLPAGKTYAIGVFEGGAWQEVKGSSFDGSVVKGPIAHFSKYSIVLVDGSVVVTPEGNCTEALATFAPCGGDLLGTWSFTDVCIQGAVADDPFKGTCPSAVITAELEKNGELSFDGTNFALAAGTSVITTKASFPTSCLGNGKTCAQAEADLLKDGASSGSCVDTAGTCNCNTKKVQQDDAKTVPYAISGNTFTHEDKVTNYCVKGSQLYGRDVGGDVLFVLTKKP